MYIYIQILGDMMDNNKSKKGHFVLYSGTYLNKGGAAIAYGTLKVLSNLGINYAAIIDPEPQFPREFFENNKLKQIYRYSDILSTRKIKSISPLYLAEPFVKCILNSNKKEIKELAGIPIWHIGDSPFSDYRSSLSVIGQVVALYTLKLAIKGKVIIGGISLEYPRTRIGEKTLRYFFKSVDYFYVRGIQTSNNLKRLGVPQDKISMICDFAYHLNKQETERANNCIKLVKDSTKSTIALILRDYSHGTEREKYLDKVHEFISVLEKDYDVYFISTSYAYLMPENDCVFLEKLKVDRNRIINIKDYSPEEIIYIFSKFNLIISTRLHGAVIGSLANVPTLHFYEGRKSLEVIKEIFGEELIPLVRLSDFTVSKDFQELLDMISDLIQRKEQISSEMKSQINVARISAINELKSSLEEMNLINKK